MEDKIRPRYREENDLRTFLKNRALHTNEETDTQEFGLQVASFMYFFHCLSDQETSIEKILELIADAEKQKEKAIKELDQKPKLSAELTEIFDEMRLEDEAIGHESLQDAFAATLFVILNSLLWSMATRVRNRGGKTMPVKAGRTIGETSLLELIRAAGNNFRHFEQWDNESSTDARQIQNTTVLKAAGITPPWSRNVCAEILLMIGWTNVDELTLEIRKLAADIFEAQTEIRL